MKHTVTLFTALLLAPLAALRADETAKPMGSGALFVLRVFFHPDVSNAEIWPGPEGYPWANSGITTLDARGVAAAGRAGPIGMHVDDGRLQRAGAWVTSR